MDSNLKKGIVVKYDTKLKFSKIINASSEFPENEGKSDNPPLDLHIKNEPGADVETPPPTAPDTILPPTTEKET